MCPPPTGLPLAPYCRLAPPEIDRVQHVHIVVIRRPVASTENNEFLANSSTGHGTEGHGNIAADVGRREVKCIGVEDVKFVETTAGIAATEYIDVGAY